MFMSTSYPQVEVLPGVALNQETNRLTPPSLDSQSRRGGPLQKGGAGDDSLLF